MQEESEGESGLNRFLDQAISRRYTRIRVTQTGMVSGLRQLDGIPFQLNYHDASDAYRSLIHLSPGDIIERSFGSKHQSRHFQIISITDEAIRLQVYPRGVWPSPPRTNFTARLMRPIQRRYDERLIARVFEAEYMMRQLEMQPS